MNSPAFSASALTSFWAIALAALVARIVLLGMSEANLGPDEAQYWFWSRELAFGYFSKPPLIGWTIAATTGLFGDTEWAVRLAAPFFHFGAAAFLYLTAKRLFDDNVAFWVGLGWITLPGVAFSSFLITTDAPLLFFWSAGLYILTLIYNSDKAPIWAFAALGGAIGFGLLSKYAMIYFPLALAGAAILDPILRRKLVRPSLFVTAIIATILVTPNILWNAANDFQTVSHTAANANWSSQLFNLASFAQFFVAQFGVVGIIAFSVFLYFIARRPIGVFVESNKNPAIMLLAFSLTPLAIVSVQAFISRAHANWAAASFPALIILITAFLAKTNAFRWAKASVALNGALALLFAAGISNFALIDAVGLSDATREIRGWREQAAAVSALGVGFSTIAIDDRALIGEMLFYEGEANAELVAINPNVKVDTHYEAFKAFDPAHHDRVLFVTTRNDAAHVDYRFRHIAPLGPHSVQIGDTERTYHLFDISEYYGPGANTP